MPVHEDSSIVPDSTMSTSPPTTPAVVKRATRVYGRRPAEPVGDDFNISLLYSAKSSSSNSSVYRTGPHDTDEEIPPSSDPAPDSSMFSHVNDDEAEDDNQDASPKFEFSWKQQMKKMDEEYNRDADMEEPVEEKSASKRSVGSGHTHALSPQMPDSPIVPLLPTSPAEPHENAPSKAAFEGSLSTLRASPSRSSLARSPSPILAPSRARRNKLVIHGSDSEEGEKDSSPSNPHPITTPKLHSSPTPPTSEDDMSALSKRDIKEKGKAKAPVRDVAPLLFSEHPVSTFRPSKAPKDKGSKRQKIKAPTRKELKETARHRLRLAADQEISIPRAEVDKFSIKNFFARLPGVKPPEIEADPIVDFSSDRHTSPAAPYVTPSPPILRQSDGSPLKRSLKRVHKSPLKSMPSLPDLGDDSDEDLPEIGAFLAQEKKVHAEKLLEEKKRALAVQATKYFDSDDDDLQVVDAPDMQMAIKEEEAERMSGRKKRPSEGWKRQLNLGGIGLKAQKAKKNLPKSEDFELLRRVGTQKGKKGDPRITQEDLNRMLKSMSEVDGQKTMREKEEEFIQRGGRLKNQDEGSASSVQEASKVYAEKGLNLPEGKDKGMDVEGEDDGSDEDWSPELGAQLRGSASRSPSPDNDHEEADEEGDVAMVNDDAQTNEEEDTDNKLPLKARRPALKAIVDSDDEDIPPTRLNFSPQIPVSPSSGQPVNASSIFAHRGSMSSIDDPTEDEGDKENETSRMWDRGEDKENTAVVRHPTFGGAALLGPRKSSLFGLQSGLTRQLSMSPGSRLEGDNDENSSPFEYPIEDDPFTSPSRPARLLTSFEARLKLASPVASLPAPTLGLAPFIGAKPQGFSQFPDDEPSASVGPAPLQASFSDLFESGTEAPIAAVNLKRPLGDLGGSFTDEVSPRNKLARADTLDLTQDVTLQPAFEVSGTFLRKADQIFEKEQEYIMEAANKKTQKESELYVNDHGFLTQTRPDVSTPEVYRHPSPTQAKSSIRPEPQSTLRRPLRTISLSDEVDFNSPAPLGRLHKRAMTPTSPLLGAGYKSSPSPSPSAKRPANAFDVLKRASKAHADKPKRNPLEKSEFIEQEAQESDDDEMFGFGPGMKGKDDEEDGEDLDQTLEALVDDADMDEDTVAAELVKEKFQEHEKEADERLEKYHQAAAQGEMRKKRKNLGLGMEDSDDESDDDERNRRIRRNMKKQKIERDTIKALGEHEETKSFFNVYEQNLAPDEADFAYLQDSQSQDIVMANVDEMVDEDEGPRREVITTAELTRLAREAARKPRIDQEEAQDPSDVSWIDGNQSDEENNLHVKPIALKPLKQPITRHRAPDQTDFDAGLDALPMPPPKTVVTEHNLTRMQTWAKVEGRSRNNGTTGRNVGGAAVTGHKAKSGGGSLRKGAVIASASTASVNSSESRRPVREPSLLAKVAADSRTTRFG